MKTYVALIGLVVALAGGTVMAKEQALSPRAQAALDKALAGRTAGQPQSCVSLTELRSTRIINQNTILFEGTGGRIWRNDPPRGCPGLSPMRVIVTKTSLSQHCRGDIFQIIDSSSQMPLGACGFGDFVPYTKVK